MPDFKLPRFRYVQDETGKVTEMSLDGQPLKLVQSLKLEADAAMQLTVLTLQLLVQPEIDIPVDEVKDAQPVRESPDVRVE